MKETNAKRKIKENGGITLIVLVITIIVLLILAGVSISMISGGNSIINRAGNAKEETVISEEKEQILLAYTLVDEAEVTDKLLKEQLQKNGNNVTVSYSENASIDDPTISLNDYVFENQEELLVEFNDTHHKYLVDAEGNVSNSLDNVSNSTTDWAKINYEIRTDAEGKQYCAVTGLKSGSSKTSLTKINIAKTYKGVPVLSIEKQAFYSCENVLKVTIPNTITTIGEGAFRSCSSLTEIVIPDSVTDLICKGNWGAFSYCTNLENVTIGKNITNFGPYMFDGCVNIKHIKIPRNIPSFGLNTFRGCTQLTKAGIGVTEGIELESGITKIPDNLFSGSNLEEITIPNTVTTIGKAAFNECKKLSEITIPNGVTTIGEGAFRCCSSLTEIVIPDSVTEILTSGAWGSFRSCTNLKNVTLGKNITRIGNNVFAECTSLKHINIPGNIQSFGSNTFNGCTQLTKAGVGVTEGIELESGITKIPDSLFYGSNLEEITIPNTVTVIGMNSFNECRKLPEITIPNGVTTIGAGAFRCCSSLTEIVIPDSVTQIQSSGSWGSFRSCTNLRTVTLSKEIKTINKHTFEECTNLDTIIYNGSSHTTEASLKSAGITSIATDAFSGTKITAE